MKQLVEEYSFSQEQLNSITRLAKELSLTETVVKLLVARGVDTREKIEKFLSPSKKHFLSPMLLSGMQEATELIRRARDEEWNVVVFGDYDADGICASAIMYYALKRYGIEPRIYIPERSDGYGLSVDWIDRIFDECIPDLFITVDCGISNYKEVEYVRDLGAYVIVTDHHELPEITPNCITVNPKFKDDYPYDNLCGAGVAFKLATALIGERAYDLLDFAALATVADSVPLLGENRDIVHEGLKLVSTSPRPCFAALLGKNQQEVTAQTLAFSIAPRINAAGRMGDAKSALDLFLSEDSSNIYELAVKLSDYNIQRQRCCELLYESAKEKIKKKGAFGNVIMLSDENWSSGFVGIVAARLAEEYSRPTLLFVRNGDMLKGSARSIESINIFEMLRHCSEYIAEFGGHAQAAGINVSLENFDKLEAALGEAIGKAYTPDDFIPRLPVVEEIKGEFPIKLARELGALEPYGVGHKRPLFFLTARSATARPVKNKSPHVSIRTEQLDLMYFNGIKHTKLIESDVKKRFVFECNCSVFRGKESVKGFVREILYDGTSSNIPDWRFAVSLDRLKKEDEAVRSNAKFLTRGEISSLVDSKLKEGAYGLLLVASSRKTMEKFPSVKLRPDLVYPSSHNVANTLLISPAEDAFLADYREVIFLDTPSDFALSDIAGKIVSVNKDDIGYDALLKLDCSREKLLEVFACIRSRAGGILGDCPAETAIKEKGLGFTVEECMFALSVFEQLGLIDYESGSLVVYRGVHADLNNSSLYRKVLKLQGKL